MTAFTRLTVVGTARKAELVVPDDEAIGGLIPRLMELLEEPTGPVARPLALVRSTGEQLDDARSAAEQDLADGEQLRLVRADDAPPPPEVADVTDVVGDTYADRPRSVVDAPPGRRPGRSPSVPRPASALLRAARSAPARLGARAGRHRRRDPARSARAPLAGYRPDRGGRRRGAGGHSRRSSAQAGPDRSARLGLGVRRPRLGRPRGRRRSRPAPAGRRARRGGRRGARSPAARARRR